MKVKTLKSAYYGYVLVSAIAGAALSIAVTTGSLEILAAVKIFMGVFSLSFPVMMPFLLIWWKKVDEAVKEAHKWAWFWGGSFGMMLVIWIATANMFMQGRLLATMLISMGMQDYGFEVGVLATVLVMSYGYIGAWALWWSRHK